jgi:hypothetical protein
MQIGLILPDSIIAQPVLESTIIRLSSSTPYSGYL